MNGWLREYAVVLGAFALIGCSDDDSPGTMDGGSNGLDAGRLMDSGATPLDGQVVCRPGTGCPCTPDSGLYHGVDNRGRSYTVMCAEGVWLATDAGG